MKALTEEELRLLPSFYDNRWLPVSRMTGPPADKDAAFEAVKELCRRVRRKQPKQAIWLDRFPIRKEVEGKSQCLSTRPCATCLLNRLTKKYKFDSLVHPAASSAISFYLVRRMTSAADHWMLLHQWRWPVSNHPAVMAANGYYPVLFDFLDYIGRVRYEFVRPWRQICLQAGIWWFEGDGDIVVFAERPMTIVRNEMGQISNADGPAIVYNNHKIYAWRGRLIEKEMQDLPPGWYEKAEGRGIYSMRQMSIMIDMYGPAKVLKETGKGYKRLVESSKWGKLWQISIGRSNRMFVEVENSSGNHETHVIPVDPWLRPLMTGDTLMTGDSVRSPFASRQRTALQAIASTFGMEAE